MKFEFISNACGIFHGNEGTKILCDPWIVNGVFDGSWCHIHPLKTTMDGLIKDVSNKVIDALYISHIHPDHYDDRYFNFPKNTPIIVLDHKHNFLIKNLERNGFTNLIFIKDKETISFNEFEITLYAPFVKNNFYDAGIGNLIDSAMVVKSGDITALNANDNTPTVEACKMLKEKFGKIDLAMINYNAAGPYPSCFDNLSEPEKTQEHKRILVRNYDYMVSLVNELQPKYVLPFAGAYVLGGKFSFKNKYLGVSTWDKCKEYILTRINNNSEVICLQERGTFDLSNGTADKKYIKLDEADMNKYINEDLINITYPYEKDDEPDFNILIKDVKSASIAMQQRMQRIGIAINTNIFLSINNEIVPLYDTSSKTSTNLTCSLDNKLLRRILDRTSHWNNAEVGCHISFIRDPNTYEPDTHAALQFFHL